MKAIGIDIGTTAISGVLLDAESGKVVRSVTQNSEAFITTEHTWERIQDTEKIIRIASELLDGLITPDTAVIGITGQMHGILYFDQNGNAVSPLYTWQDGRGNQPYRDGKTYSEVVSLPSGYGVVTDFYNTEHGIRPQGAVGFATVHDYFAMKLTGRQTPVVHASDAASLGGFDLLQCKPTYALTGEVTAGFELIGHYRGIPVSIAIGDNQASAFGAMANDGDILLNVGTGSQISVVASTPINGENIETRPYTDGKYLVVGAALCGGRAYAMLEKFCSDIVYRATGTRMELYRMLDGLSCPEHRGLVADTRFCGTRKAPQLTGGIYGMTQENFTIAHMKYAFLNGIVNELYGMFCEMHQEGGALVGSGNGIRKNPALIEAAELRFGAKMKIPVHVEEAAYGAALFGLTATGILGNEDQVKKIIRYQSAVRETL